MESAVFVFTVCLFMACPVEPTLFSTLYWLCQIHGEDRSHPPIFAPYREDRALT